MELKNFPDVQGSYGGNQSWFEKSLWAAGGCGVIASSNIYYYFKKENKIRKEDYMALARALYYWLKPLHFFNPQIKEDTYGIISPGLWTQRSLRFFRLRGLFLEAKVFRFIRKRALVEAKRALLKGQLPAIMVLGPPGSTPYVNHFMVITGFSGDRLIFSTWGKRMELEFDELAAPGIFFHLIVFKGVEDGTLL
ncbi:MAG: hypothetical protein GX046_03145 [Tissierellia bacterium]|jgi:hypothetical protein|nr:hypothetical protein [Tissierellia bacterium]